MRGEKPAPAEWALYALLILLLALLSVGTYYHLGEDAFITFRYADNLAAGRGLVFNPGEQVEGYSNLLWLLLLVPGEWLGLRMHVVARFLAFLFLAAFVHTAWRTGRRLAPAEAPRWFSWWMPLAIVLEPLLRFHADRGLETVPYVAMLGMALLVLGRGGPVWAAGLLAAAAALTRPEGIGLALALAPVAWLAAVGAGSAAAWRSVLVYTAVPAGAFLAQLLFRRALYGEWVPNTMIAKKGGIGGGWTEVAAYSGSHAFVPLLALLGSLAGLVRERTRPLAAGALLLALATVAFQVRAGALTSEGFRYLAPLAVFVVVGGWLLLDWLYNLLDRLRPGLAPLLPLHAAGILLLALVVWLPRAEGAAGRYFRGNTDAPRSRLHTRLLESSTWNIRSRARWYFSDPVYHNAEAGRWLRANLPADAVLAADQMGQLGYYAAREQTIIDLLGLMDAHIARHGLSMDYLIRRDPAYIVMEVCLDSPYWPREWRLRPHVPFLRDFVLENEPEFSARYRPRWLLHPNISVMEVGFLVWQSRGLDGDAEMEEVFLGVDDETFEWAWRVL